MISSITISGEATYPKEPTCIDELRKQVLFFGDNGSGKTTISRIVAKSEAYPECSVSAPSGTLFQVYNSDFVDVAYRESAYPGVFTLGEKEREIEDRIEELQGKRTELEGKVESYKNQIDSTKADEDLGKSQLADTVWEAKNQLDSSLNDAFKGRLKSRKVFLDHALSLVQRDPVPVENSLIEEAKVLYGTPPARRKPLPRLATTSIEAIENSEDWGRVLVGSKDVPLAALIEHLGNHDWVRRGVDFLGESQTCPFCQRAVPEQLKTDLERVFDKTYEEGTTRLRRLQEDYIREANAIGVALDGIQDGLQESSGLDLGRLRTIFAENRAEISRKVEAPSTTINVVSTSALLGQVQAAIEAQNAVTAEQNAKLDNRVEEAKRLTCSVWQLVLSRTAPNLAQYREASAKREKKLEGLRQKLKDTQKELSDVGAELLRLRASLANVEGTVTRINALLERFGFKGFQLRVTEDQKHYVLVREDGEQVGRSLSEGEKTLVSFLYFYHLAQGGLEESETDRKRVLVIDDPISSLDANVLFLVSTLVREMLGWVHDEQGLVQQVIVLTHNAYFHKEVAAEKRDGLVKNPQHWMVRKHDGVSRVEACSKNPVRSSYSLLWGTVRRARDGKDIDHHALANAMRRILENYFCFLGGSWDSGLRERFEGEDLAVLNALISWVHDGSHRVFDGLEIGPGHSPTQYLSVFERIFEHSRHGAHFEMMVNSEDS